MIKIIREYVRKKISLWLWALKGRNYCFRISHYSSCGDNYTYIIEGKSLFGKWHECFSVRFTDKIKAEQYIKNMKEQWIYNPPAKPPYQRVFYKDSYGKSL